MPLPAVYAPESWLTTMRPAVFAWARSQLDASVTVAWNKQGRPSPPKPFVLLGVLLPPVPQWIDEHRNTGTAVQVTAAVPGATYPITVGGQARAYVAGNPTTLSAIRDGLMAAVAAAGDPYVPYAAAPDTFALADAQGGPAPDMTCGENLALKVADLILGDGIATFTVDAYADSPDQATVLATMLQKSLEKNSVQEALQRAGWSFLTTEGARKPDAVVGSAWEDRCGFDLRLACRTRAIDVLDYLDPSQAASLEAFGITGSVNP